MARKTPKKKWLRKWVKQLDEELEAAERRKLKNTYIITSHAGGGGSGGFRDIPTSQMYMVDVFIVELMVGLVLIAYAAAIVIEVVALTS